MKGQERTMHPDKTRSHAENPRLDSWKEIAAYLDRDERTAKRWEKTRGLPIHRLPGGRSGVFAFAPEIDDWQRQGPALPPVDAASDIALAEPDFVTAAEEAALASASPLPHRKTLFGARYLQLESPHAQTAVLLLPILILTVSFFPFTHRSGARDLVSGQSLARSQSSAHLPSKEVENLYLNGRYYWNKRTPSDLNTALNLFKQAVQRDPSYAPAYIGLADTYSLLVEYAALPPSAAYPPAIAAARRAISLDPSLPEAHRSLAFTSFYWNWNRSLSETEFRKAIAIDPRDATTHHWFANTLMASQRFQEAFEQIEQARTLDPTAISILADRGHILSLVGRKEEARETLLQVEKADPSFMPAHWFLAQIYYSDKNDRAYLDELRQIAAVTRRHADSEIYRAGEAGFAAGGEKGLHAALAEAQLKLYRQGVVPAFDVADALARFGKRKQAIQYLKLAYLSRDTQFLTLNGQNVLPALRDDAEFKELAEKSNQPHEERAEVADLIGLARY
jgi:Tfp pilus assembly protein PilF